MLNGVFPNGTNGGGVFADGAVTLNGGLFQNNRSVNGQGGGLLTISTLALSGTQFISNSAAGSGGGASANSLMTLNGGLFQDNRSATGSGGGLSASGLVLTGTRFIGNSADYAGGGAVSNFAATLNGGLFQNNVGPSGGGLYAFGAVVMTGTQFLGNRATGSGGALGFGGFGGRIVNALFAGNSAAGNGAAIYQSSFSGMQILHTTIVSPTLANGSAIYMDGSTLGITNTIIASHTTGINAASGFLHENYNLFYGNTTNKNGTITGGGNDVLGNPAFVNPAAGNYHLGAGSAAIDAGFNVGIMKDFDGDARPLGGGFDIGYDEYWLQSNWLYLPFIRR